jgi:hypothetical protein
MKVQGSEFRFLVSGFWFLVLVFLIRLSFLQI